MTKPVIIKREVKGQALSYAELDQNFQNLDDATISIGVSGGNTVVNDLNGTTTLVPSDEIFLTADNTAKTITVSEKILRLYAYVHNANGTTINKGQPVYLYQATGDKPSVKLAQNTGDATSAKTLGLAAETIGIGGDGYIITQGKLVGVDTSMFAEGDTLYLGATAGSLTATKPYAPNHLVYIGVVAKANQGQGEIYVRPQNGYELEELHNVNIDHNVALANGQTLVYNSSNGLWENNTSGGTINGGTAYAIPVYTDPFPNSTGTILDDSAARIRRNPGSAVTLDITTANTDDFRIGIDTANGSSLIFRGDYVGVFEGVILETYGSSNNSIVLHAGTDNAGVPTGRIELGSALALKSLTTTQSSTTSRTTGSLIWNSTDGRISVYNGSSWESVLTNTSSIPGTSLTGTTLASNVVSSSLTSVGTLTALNTSGTITSSAGANVAVIDRSGTDATYANGATVDFANFSGVITVNNTGSTGQIMMVLCGGGSTLVLGYSGTGTPHKTGTITAVGAISGYRWTNDTGASDTFTFHAVRTRNSI